MARGDESLPSGYLTTSTDPGPPPVSNYFPCCRIFSNLNTAICLPIIISSKKCVSPCGKNPKFREKISISVPERDLKCH